MTAHYSPQTRHLPVVAVTGVAIVVLGLVVPPEAYAQDDVNSSHSPAITIGNMAQVYATDVAPLATIDGVAITGSGYGSSLYPVPGVPGEYYGLTDRGPNVDGPDGVKVEPLSGFSPSIGRFRLTNDGRAVLEETIILRDVQGVPYTGRVNAQASTGETIVDLNGAVLPADDSGYDSEGLVALPDGTFWVSDEYGPFITHFDAQGRQIDRLSPMDGTLPAELANRTVNRGMEGLTITPDGSTLVGIMQSPLSQPDLTVSTDVAAIRIITYGLLSGETHEYLYLLADAQSDASLVSEIAALSNTTFVVFECDQEFPPASSKRLWAIDLSGATDVGPQATVSNAEYDGGGGGLLVRGSTVEALVGDADTPTAAAILVDAGITPVTKSLFLDVTGLLATLDPTTRFFSHDKLEGVAVLDGGRRVIISNDSDFGIDGLTTDTPPYQLQAKVSPTTGEQDDGEFLLVDMTRTVMS